MILVFRISEKLVCSLYAFDHNQYEKTKEFKRMSLTSSQIGVPEVSQPTILRGPEIMVNDIDAKERRPFRSSNRNIGGKSG